MEIIQSNEVETQEELAGLLGRAGYNVTQATVSFLLRLGTKEDEQVMQSFLDEIQEKRPVYYDWILQKPFYRHTIGPIRKLPHWFAYPLYRLSYIIARRVFDFN